MSERPHNPAKPHPEEKHEFEALLIDLFAGFAGLATDQVDQAIEGALQRIVENLGLDRSTLFQFLDENAEETITHSWARPGFPPLQFPRHLVKNNFPYVYQTISKGEIFQFASLQELPPEAARDVASLRTIGQKSNLTIPLIEEGMVFGALAFGTLKKERTWSKELVDRLRLVSQIIANVLARARAARALRTSEERYRTFIASSRDGVGRFETTSPIATSLPEEEQIELILSRAVLAECNDVFAGFWNRQSPREMFQLPLCQFIGLDDWQIRELLQTFIRSGYHFEEAEFPKTDLENQVRYISSSAYGVIENAHLVRCWVVMRDITQKNLAVIEANRLRQQLGHATRVTTLGELASVLGHELNQPLAAILSNVESAEMILHAGPSGLQEMPVILADIRNDARRAAGVIQQMRTLLKRQDIALEPIDIHQLIKNTAGLAQPLLRSCRADLRIDTAAALPPARGDAVLVQQVMLNLLVNALDAMNASSSPTRAIVIQVVQPEPEWIEVAVTDTGPGIPVEHLPKLFDPFFTTKKEGIGMGLGICRTIIQHHGGDIVAKNNPEGGASVRFTLPASDGEQVMTK